MVDRNHWSVRDGVAELLDHGVAAEFPAYTLAIGMLRLLGADYASFSEIDISRAHGARLGYAPRAAADRFPAANVGALMAYHPVHRHYAATMSMRAERVTDLVSPAAWRRSRAYRELSSHLDLRHQLTIPLAMSARRYCVLQVYRTGGEFADQERDLAMRVQSVLIGLRTLATHAAAAADTTQPARPLTARELDVLAVLAGGLTAQAIGHRLGISPHTATRHIEAIYAKLGTHDRATTVLRAHELGLLTN